MCGIFFYKGKLYKTDDLTYYVEKLNDRGPDNKKIVQVSDDIILGFTRLCINDLSEAGDQPFHKNGIYLICNGEIYNFKQLIEENQFQMNDFPHISPGVYTIQASINQFIESQKLFIK